MAGNINLAQNHFNTFLHFICVFHFEKKIEFVDHQDLLFCQIACAKFLSRIHWTHATAHARTILQPECARMFLEQLFDRDPRVIE